MRCVETTKWKIYSLGYCRFIANKVSGGISQINPVACSSFLSKMPEHEFDRYCEYHFNNEGS